MRKTSFVIAGLVSAASIALVGCDVQKTQDGRGRKEVRLAQEGEGIGEKQPSLVAGQGPGQCVVADQVVSPPGLLHPEGLTADAVDSGAPVLCGRAPQPANSSAASATQILKRAGVEPLPQKQGSNLRKQGRCLRDIELSRT